MTGISKGGLSYFDENGLQDNFFEATLYVKVYYKLDYMDNRMRIGFGEGLSWASDVPIIEIDEASISDKEVAQFLNYLDISFDFDLGRLLRIKSLNNLYLGYTVKTPIRCFWALFGCDRWIKLSNVYH